MINHSNFGEFAYRNKEWKLVYKLGGKNLNQSRGKPTVAELYNLEDDIAESNDSAKSNPELLRKLTAELNASIQNGATRPGVSSKNDTEVRFDTTQALRWAPASKQ